MGRRGSGRVVRRIGRILLLLGMLGPLARASFADGQLLSDLAYAQGSAAERSLDLFLPDAKAGKAPLVVFVHSRFWDRADRARDVSGRFARPLRRAGVAVAIVRHRLAPAHAHPAAAQDVAAAMAFLIERADEYGLDRQRIYLAGRSSGAHLAALITLDPQYLGAHGLAPSAVRGVAAWSGVFDLDPPEGSADESVRALYTSAFGDAAARRAASPLNLARKDAPIFLLLVAQHDLPGARADADAFSKALRDAGHPAAETFLVMGRDHMNMIDLGVESNPARRHLFTLLGLDRTQGSIEEVFRTRRFWRAPSFSTAGFWEDEGRVESHEVSARFLGTLNSMFARRAGPPPLQPLRYHALDLLDYVERQVPGGAGPGDFLTLTNQRGEQVVWRRSELTAYRPQIVIGLDDERELFKLTDFYHTRRRYTWKQPEEERWVLARPLGAFVYFGEPAPARIDPRLFGRFALTPASFAVSESDPLAPLRDLPEAERVLLTEELRCVSCHRFRGVGARAGHLRGRDGERVGGFGLPLEEYPAEVWRRYCFEQLAVAEEIGASPVALGENARLLFELVERERRR
jgi:acetyl esterase/lipase